MKFSFRKNVVFTLFIVAFSYFFTSCMKEDNWADWKYINEKWYNAHKNDEGFTVLSSGVSYKMIKDGGFKNLGKPQSSSSYVTVDYEGKLYNDSVFDSATNTDFIIGYTVSGFQEILYKMHPGDEYEIRIPWDQGYGSDGNGNEVPPYSTLIFDVKLKSFYNPQ